MPVYRLILAGTLLTAALSPASAADRARADGVLVASCLHDGTIGRTDVERIASLRPFEDP